MDEIAPGPGDTPGPPFERTLRTLLSDVAGGRVAVAEGVLGLRNLAFADLGYAKVDHHRELRQGNCEIVYSEGKSVAQVAGIVRRLVADNAGPILVTRARPEQVAVVATIARAAGLPVRTEPDCGAIAILRNPPPDSGRIMIVTGGTADLPVAREASLTATVLGGIVELHPDVGVAGLHRLRAIQPKLEEAEVVVVVAGMEGALASVVGGLVGCPVIACPTSVGYGASFGGLAALLAMLNSCTPGVVCVNIDDGVGAGYVAGLIARRPNGEEA